MFQRSLVMAIGFCLAVLPALRADDRGEKIVGTWKAKAKVGGYDQFLTIANDNGEWAVKGTIEKDGVVVGSSVGEKVKFADGQLTYHSKYIKKPAASWQEHDITLRVDGDTLTMSWAAKPGDKSTRAFERAGEPKPSPKTDTPAKKEDPKPKTADAVKAELARLEGTYSCVSTEQGNEKLTPEQLKKLKLVVKDNKWTVYVEDRVLTLATFTIDPTKKPKAIDLTGTMGGDKGKKYLGIYELNGTELKLCIGDTKTRPQGFEAKKGYDRQFEVWKRAKD